MRCNGTRSATGSVRIIKLPGTSPGVGGVVSAFTRLDLGLSDVIPAPMEAKRGPNRFPGLIRRQRTVRVICVERIGEWGKIYGKIT